MSSDSDIPRVPDLRTEQEIANDEADILLTDIYQECGLVGAPLEQVYKSDTVKEMVRLAVVSTLLRAHQDTSLAKRFNDRIVKKGRRAARSRNEDYDI